MHIPDARGPFRMSFQSCSVFLKVGLFLCVSAFVSTSVAVFSPAWLVSRPVHTQLGVVVICTDGHCQGLLSARLSPRNWQVATMAMEMTGCLVAASCFVFAVLVVFLPATSGKYWVKVTTLILTLTATAFILVGVLVCVVSKDDDPPLTPGVRSVLDLGWSLALAITAGLLHLATAVCFTLDICCIED